LILLLASRASDDQAASHHVKTICGTPHQRACCPGALRFSSSGKRFARLRHLMCWTGRPSHVEPISSITGDTIMTKSAIYSSAAVVALSLAGAPPAMSEEPIVKSIAVSYADLDPADAKGARLLYARIRWAARKVCTLDDEVGYASQARAQAQCVRRAVDHAIYSVNSPALVAMYRGKPHRAGS
jgi:UrcA family protein